jgi:hypothetical protein
MADNFRRQIWHVGDGPESRINATAQSHVVVPEPVRLLTLEVLLETKPDQFIMIFDATALPPDGTLPVWRGVAVGKQLTSMNYIGLTDNSREQGLDLYTGLVCALSSTADVLTLSAAGPVHWQAIIRVNV